MTARCKLVTIAAGSFYDHMVIAVLKRVLDQWNELGAISVFEEVVKSHASVPHLRRQV